MIIPDHVGDASLNISKGLKSDNATPKPPKGGLNSLDVCVGVFTLLIFKEHLDQ